MKLEINGWYKPNNKHDYARATKEGNGRIVDIKYFFVLEDVGGNSFNDLDTFKILTNDGVICWMDIPGPNGDNNFTYTKIS